MTPTKTALTYGSSDAAPAKTRIQLVTPVTSTRVVDSILQISTESEDVIIAML